MEDVWVELEVVAFRINLPFIPFIRNSIIMHIGHHHSDLLLGLISDQVWAFPFSSFEVNIIYK